MNWRLVLADDDPTLRRLLRVLLERDGRFEVVGEAADGREAIALLGEADPDLLLLDLAMPHMDGLEVLVELDGRTRPVVVVLTGFTEQALCDQVLALGARACLQKGNDFASLADRLVDAVAA